MTQRNETQTIPLGGEGAHLYRWRFSNGADTPPALRGQGILAENTYTANIGTQLDGPVLIEIFPNYFYPSCMSFATAGWKAWQSPGEPSNIKALSNLLEKYKQSDFNLAVTVGESREAWHMIADRMLGFSEALRQTKRGNLTGALRALGSSKRPSRKAQRKLDSGDVSGSFLELQYGWVPLMHDIYNASELINKPYIPKPTLRTSVHSDGPERETYLSKYQSYSKTHKNERSVYHIARLSTSEIGWAVRLGLINPVTVAWELTTLSFVLDWFLPVGDLIQAVEASYVLPIGSYIKSDVLRQHCELNLAVGDHCWGYNDIAIARTAGKAYVKGTQFTRTVGEGAPSNIFDGTGPRESLLSFDLSIRRVASASALLHQAFRAFRR